MTKRTLQALALFAVLAASALSTLHKARSADTPFKIVEAGIDDIQNAYKAKTLTAHQLVQMYLDRIEAYDRNGPKINSVISINPKALEEADRLDATYKATGQFVGPLHGIPILIKDQVDVGGMPTTLGSLVMKDYVPPMDAGAVEKVRKAGAIVLAKMTLGEMGGGDTYGSLFGATRNPYDLERTVVNEKGAPHLNTYLIYAASMAVPAGFTAEGLPVGITFFGPPYSEPTLFKLAYAYEQATHHRIPPKTTPPLVR